MIVNETYAVVNEHGIAKDMCVLLECRYVATWVLVRSLLNGCIYETPFFTIREPQRTESVLHI